MSAINRFDGIWGEQMAWDGARVRRYEERGGGGGHGDLAGRQGGEGAQFRDSLL